MTDVSDFVAARDHVHEELVQFVRALRRAGLTIHANAGTTAARALVEVGFDDEPTARAALRACLVTEPDDIATFDRLFREFWQRLVAGRSPDGPTPREDDGPDGAMTALAAGAEDPETAQRPDLGESKEDASRQTSRSLQTAVPSANDDGDREAVEAAWYSPSGTRTAVAGDDRGEPRFADAFDELTRGLATLPRRRWRAGGHERPDVRRALRASFATGGTVVSLPRRERDGTGVRALWLVDVSRSVLDTVDRSFLLGALRYARHEWRAPRVFIFDEAVREVSSAFDEPTAAAALDTLDRADAEWGGGTRIGDSLAELRERAPTAVDHSTTVFVVSDGLEMGDVGTLERELAWLSRRAASVLWLNPLASALSFEPTASGMEAALPFVDGLFAFGDADDLAEIGRQLHRRGARGRIGYEYDPRRRVS